MNQDELKSLVSYDHITGEFKKLNDSTYFKSGHVYTGCIADGYVRIRLKGKLYSGHRLAWLYVYGFMPDRIDHIDGNRLNNAISNLRACNARQNALNADVRSSNRCGVKGVTKTYNGKFTARVTVNYKQVHIGTFNTVSEAVNARNEYLKSLPDYEFNRI